MVKKTENGIDYELYIDSFLHEKALLYPELERHSKPDVIIADSWIRRQHKVTGIQVRWRKSDVDPLTDKIPDFLIIKTLRKKIGGLESYISELEDKIEKEKIQSIREGTKAIKKEEAYIALRQQIAILNQKNKKLRKDNEELIIKLVKYNQEPKCSTQSISTDLSQEPTQE